MDIERGGNAVCGRFRESCSSPCVHLSVECLGQEARLDSEETVRNTTRTTDINRPHPFGSIVNRLLVNLSNWKHDFQKS